MKNLIAAVVLLVSTCANATIVTVDFEEFAGDFVFLDRHLIVLSTSNRALKFLIRALLSGKPSVQIMKVLKCKFGWFCRWMDSPG